MRSTKHLTTSFNHRYFSIARPTQCDVVVIGGGIAGSSVGYELAKNHNLNVIILEQEHFAGYHSTGRAAGLFAEDYGCDPVKLLTIASRKWFENPPLDCNDNIAENPILSRLGMLCTSTAQNQSAMIHHHYDNSPCKEQLQLIDREAAKSIFPLLQYENESMIGDQFVYDPYAAALDVANVHASYLKGCRNSNVPILCNQRAENIQKQSSKDSNWHILTDKNEEFECRMIVNAAGAWSDYIAIKCGLNPMGIRPLRRSLIIFKPHNDEIAQCLNLHLTDEQTMPWVHGCNDKGSEDWYIGPRSKSGLLLASPANTDLDEAGDTVPDDLDIAICVDRIETFTKCKVQKIESKWAGLRCYSKDECFIIGKDPNDESFFWCSALAGQGIQAAPGYSQFLAAQIAGKDVPKCLDEIGFDPDTVSPKRFFDM